ncbi:MAG TPA: DUF5995 family protein [Symbiobacteriaceae bacterium]|nr:DUF5995 family protein [Symbiobacteriaceae bacterium]
MRWSTGAPGKGCGPGIAALYRHMTLQVKLGIEHGLFADGPRMERLDVAFAQRYFEAFDAYFSGQKPTDSWTVAFETAERDRLAVVQHLLLGINAHINLDLGIASAEVCPGAAIAGLQGDFNEIDNVIAVLVDVVMEEIGAVSPWFALLDRIAGKTDKVLVNFSIDVARQEAWALAEEMAPLAPVDQVPVIARRDKGVALFARVVKRPGFLTWLVTKLIAWREVQDVRWVIAVLADRVQPEAVLARRVARRAAVATME